MQAIRRPVDLEHLTAGVFGDQRRRLADRDGLAVAHDRHRVREALGLVDVVRRHEHRGCPRGDDDRRWFVADGSAVVAYLLGGGSAAERVALLATRMRRRSSTSR